MHQWANRSFIVIPQEEYDQLYNECYMELTTLRKKVDPNDQHGDFFETSLKTHYPKVYQDMIKNDYVLTHKDRIQNHLDDQYDFEAQKHANIQ